jgi:hypothetical protein
VILWHHALAWILLAILIIKFSKCEKLKIVAVNVIIFFSLISLIEIPFVIKNKIHQNQSREVSNYKDNLLTSQRIGYGFLKKNSQIFEKKYFEKGEIIYDAIYTTDENNFRITSKKPIISNNAILFLGCSFTFGAGLNDEGSLPFQVIEKTNHKFKGYNLAFGGYGAQQMLSLLEEKNIIANAIKDKKVKYAFYDLIGNQINRVAGTYPEVVWGISSAKYILENGEPKYIGNFGDYYKEKNNSKIKTILAKYVHNLGHARSELINSFLTKSLLEAKLRGYKIKTDLNDAELTVKMIEKSAKIVEQDYGSKFYVIFWDMSSGHGAFDDINKLNYTKKRFDELKIKYILVSEIIKDLKESGSSEKYFIKYDGHPTSLTNEIIANFIAKKIIK